MRRLSRYARAVLKWREAGKPIRDDAEVDRIAEICKQCPFLVSGKCAKCGCRVSSVAQEQQGIAAKILGRTLTNKIRMATEHCPIAKW